MTIGATLLSALAVAAPRLDEVTFKKVGTGVEVNIKGQDLAAPRQIRVNGGKSFILEFDASLVNRVGTLSVNAAGISTVQTGWFSAKPPRVRVHFKVQPNTTPTIESSDTGFRVLIGAPSGSLTSDQLLEAAGLKKPTEESGRAPVMNSQSGGAGSGVAGSLPKIADPLDKPQLEQPMTPTFADYSPQKPEAKTTGAKGAEKPKTDPKLSEGKAKPVYAAAPTGGLIKLDFVNTDVSLVLKALAMQSGLDIVTSPDIKGAITVKLQNVTVDHALDIVTGMSDLRYALVGRTYIVGQKDKFDSMLSAVSKTKDRPNETRLVPIFSGEPDQIKSAVKMAMPPESAGGSYDIIVPAKEGEEKSAGGDDKEGTKSNAPGGNGVSALYVILVGRPDVLDKAVPYLESIDRQICKAKGIPISESPDVIQDTYLITSESLPAKNLLDTVRNQRASAFKNVEMYPSPLGSERQAIILVGRKEEVLRVKGLLEEFDGATDESIVYEIRFAEPRSLRDSLVQLVPGLRVDIPPGPVSQPRIYETPPKKTSSSKSGPDGEQTSQSTEVAKAPDVNVQTEKADVEGITLPFRDTERVAKPMRLFVRGNKTQIEKALDLLGKLDIEPKQVALDVRVMEMSKEEALKVGLDWSILTGGYVKSIGLKGATGTSSSAGNVTLGDGTGKLNVLATLDQLAGNRKLIARPNFLATDGRETEYFVGDVVRYIESIQSSQNGVSVTTNSVRVGVRCSILPRVGADNRIFLDMRPVISYLRGFTQVPGGGQLPQTSERIAQTNAMMDDGETIALGGLIQDEDRKSVSGIPILKDLPIIGRLFSREDTVRNRTEIVIFITARVVNKSNRGDAAVPRANVERNSSTPLDGHKSPFDNRKPPKKG